FAFARMAAPTWEALRVVRLGILRIRRFGGGWGHIRDDDAGGAQLLLDAYVVVAQERDDDVQEVRRNVLRVAHLVAVRPDVRGRLRRFGDHHLNLFHRHPEWHARLLP